MHVGDAGNVSRSRRRAHCLSGVAGGDGRSPTAGRGRGDAVGHGDRQIGWGVNVSVSVALLLAAFGSPAIVTVAAVLLSVPVADAATLQGRTNGGAAPGR